MIIINNLIFEVLITCLILSLLLSLIPLMRSSADLVTESAILSFQQPEQIEDSQPPNALQGMDVEGVIHYYSAFPEIPIHLSTSFGEKTYTESTLDDDPFPYPFCLDAYYMAHVISENRVIQEIYFEKMEE